MKQETSQWGKAVKKAVIDHNMTLKQLAEKIGYSNATVSQVVNGRYSNSSYKTFLGESTPFLDYLPKDKPAQSEAEYDDNENPFGRSE